MNFRQGGFRRSQAIVTLDITPLIDVIFQLLIFFLLTASFMTTPNWGVELPQASAKVTTTQPHDLIIVVTREGKLIYGEKELDENGLIRVLKGIYLQRPGARVLIQADRKAYHGHVVKVMDVAKSIGFRRLGVALQRPR
jgi:biopolymer transport protein ExbD